MNSKQLNFFMDRKDILEIKRFLKEYNCLIVNFKTKNIDYPYVDETAWFDGDNFQLYLVNPDFQHEVYFRYNEKQEHYFVDVSRSCVLEFSIGGFYPYSSQINHRSRFYYVTKYYDDHDKVSKDSRFVKWNDKFMKDFKRKFLRKTHIVDGIYFTGNAIQWYNANNAELKEGALKLIAGNY